MSTSTPLFRPAPAAIPSPSELAGWLGGELKEPGHAPERLTGVATLAEALPDEISFAASAKVRKEAEASRAGLLIVPAGMALAGRACLEVAQVWPAVATLLARLYPDPRPAPGVHPTAVIGEGARLGEGVSVGAHCVIGTEAVIGDGAALGPGCFVDARCEVGPGSRLRSGVTLQGLVRLGRNVIIHPGTVVGADGFRYEAGPAGALKIPQVGIVIIEDDVEIGANTTIDRPFLHETRIGRGTKIDNQVQIGHNVRIGAHCVIAAFVGISGSSTIGDGCIMGGGAGVTDGVSIGAGSMIGGASGVSKDLPPRSVVSGTPARPLREHLRLQANVTRLPKLIERVAALEKNAGAATEPDAS